MHDTNVVMKDGRKYSGPIWKWRPKEGYFTVIDYSASDEPTRIELNEVESAKTLGERVSINSPPEGEEQDELERARRDGWTDDT
jgi:hypothetical protein